VKVWKSATLPKISLTGRNIPTPPEFTLYCNSSQTVSWKIKSWNARLMKFFQVSAFPGGRARLVSQQYLPTASHWAVLKKKKSYQSLIQYVCVCVCVSVCVCERERYEWGILVMWLGVCCCGARALCALGVKVLYSSCMKNMLGNPLGDPFVCLHCVSLLVRACDCVSIFVCIKQTNIWQMATTININPKEHTRFSQ